MAIFLAIKGQGKKLNNIWTAYSLGVAIWAFGGLKLSTIHDNPNDAFLWWQLTYIGIIFLPTLFLHFVCTFLDIKRRLLIILSYISCFIFLFYDLFSKNLFIGNVKFLFSQFYWVNPPGPLLYLFIFASIYGLIIYSHYELYAAYRKTHDMRKRMQITYFFIGAALGWGGGFLCFLPCFGVYIYPFGNFGVFFYPLLMGYAIVRHQLMDIEVIIKKTLVFAGLLAAVSAMLVLPTLVIQEFISQSAGLGDRVAGLILSSILIIFSLRKIENFLINVTDKYLFQKKYDYKELLKTFTSEVLTVLDLNRLVKLTVNKLSDIIKLQSCGVFLLNEDKNEYNLMASQGIKEKNMVLKIDNTLASFLARTKTCLSVSAHIKEYKMPEKIIEDMNRLKLELAIPLATSQGGMMGILTLGKKKSDEEYTQDDMDILLPLARTLAIALSNAEMFEELGKTQAEAAQREKMAVIGTLSAGINHEICNPLGIARGQCEVFILNMKDGLYKNKTPDELLEKAQKIMEKVIHETDRATAITKRLSSFAKPSKGLVSHDIDIKEEIDEVLALVGYELKLDKIDIIKEIGENLSLISGDKKQLQEIFFNLLRNAAQAIKERGRIVIKARETGGKVFIDIEDTGHGIPEDKLGQIFNPFYTTKEPGKGTGLGLFIVRQVVEKNGGKISVKSKVGDGTVFTLEFPASAKKVSA
ncbi:MAG: GAF domain-containing protein [Candidatus Omnitrophica bacterium]|nr:GAF domain-containing protein [Candidatus Omnitrophota bacterium]